MDNVITFPTKSVRDRAEIERAIRDVLKDSGTSPDDSEKIISNLEEFLGLLELDFKFSIPASAAQLNEFSVALQERTSHLILERLKAEIAHIASLRG